MYHVSAFRAYTSKFVLISSQEFTTNPAEKVYTLSDTPESWKLSNFPGRSRLALWPLPETSAFWFQGTLGVFALPQQSSAYAEAPI